MLEAPVTVAPVLTALVLPSSVLATLVLFSGSTGATTQIPQSTLWSQLENLTTVLEAPVIEAPVLSTQMLPAPVLLALLEINTVHKILNFKGTTLFCREFGYVENRAFLVLIFWLKKFDRCYFYAFLQL